jgi:hypothetical protein
VGTGVKIEREEEGKEERRIWEGGEGNVSRIFISGY